MPECLKRHEPVNPAPSANDDADEWVRYPSEDGIVHRYVYGFCRMRPSDYAHHRFGKLSHTLNGGSPIAGVKSRDRRAEDQSELVGVRLRPTPVGERHGFELRDQIVSGCLDRRLNGYAEGLEPIGDEEFEECISPIDVAVQAGGTDAGGPGDLPQRQLRRSDPTKLV